MNKKISLQKFFYCLFIICIIIFYILYLLNVKSELLVLQDLKKILFFEK